MSRLKVIIVDDETLIRKLIRMKLDAERLDLEIVGEICRCKERTLAAFCARAGHYPQ